MSEDARTGIPMARMTIDARLQDGLIVDTS
jgi:hypothetical protein